MKERRSVQREPIEDEIVVDLRGSTDIPPQIIVKIFKPCSLFEITFQRKFLCHFQAIIESPSLNCFVILTTDNHTYLGSSAFVFSFPFSSSAPPIPTCRQELI